MNDSTDSGPVTEPFEDRIERRMLALTKTCVAKAVKQLDSMQQAGANLTEDEYSTMLSLGAAYSVVGSFNQFMERIKADEGLAIHANLGALKLAPHIKS
jgi:hypothetical protein